MDFFRSIRPNSNAALQNRVISQLSALPPHMKIFDAGAGECFFKSYCSHLEYVEVYGNWLSFMIQEMRRSRLVGKLYASGLLGLLGRISVIPAIAMFGIIQRWDRGSEELLCFNFYTRSRKGNVLAVVEDELKIKN